VVLQAGGLWASPVDTKYGWKEWCLAEQYGIQRLDKHFTFHYTGKVLKIDTCADLERMVWSKVFHSIEYPDFEKMVKLGIDAIWLTEQGQWDTRSASNSKNLYGWDCECALIMNPGGIRK